MDALKAVGVCALLMAPPHPAQLCGPVTHVSSPAIDHWDNLIVAASKRFNVPAEWIRAVMARESDGHTTLYGVPIVSRAGAMGLMQLLPTTWSDMRAQHDLGDDPFDPRDNILAGAAYLHEMFDRFGYPNLFAAYHAGPGRLEAVLAGMKPLPRATKAYLESIVPGVKTEASLGEIRPSMPANSASEVLFFVRAGDERSPSTTPQARLLFVPPVVPPDSDR